MADRVYQRTELYCPGLPTSGREGAYFLVELLCGFEAQPLEDFKETNVHSSIAGDISLDVAAGLDSQYRAGGRHSVVLTDRGDIRTHQIKRSALSSIRVEAPSRIPDFAVDETA